jgi:hypothetical protein
MMNEPKQILILSCGCEFEMDYYDMELEPEYSYQYCAKHGRTRIMDIKLEK